MKITKVEVFRLQADPSYSNKPIGIRVHTDAGIVGHGEAGIAYGVGGDGAYGMVGEFAKLIIGKDPMNTEFIWEMLRRCTFWGLCPGPIVYASMAAIDIALWDIKGKYFNVPVFQLLGGLVRPSIRAYASQLQFGWGNYFEGKPDKWCVTPQDYYDNCRLAIEEGYDAVKIDFFDRDEKGMRLPFMAQCGIQSPATLKRIEANIAAAREACGDSVDIIMECHSTSDALTAVQLAQLAEKYQIMALEEPNPPTVSTLEYITKYTKVPIANGERIFGRWAFAEHLKAGIVQLAQPDLCNGGGISETKKVADMCHAYDVGVQVHVAGSPLATNAALQVECCIPNFIIHEHHKCNRSKTAEGLTKYNDQPVNGHFDMTGELGQRPGIGNEWLQSAIDKALLYKVVE